MKFKSLLTFETTKYLKTSLYFSITWICLIFLFFAFYDTIQQNVAQISQLYATFPKGLLEVFGKGANSLTSVSGYFGGQIMLYLMLSGCIFTVFITANSLASEIANRNILFLLSKPISRTKIYLAKFIAIMVSLLVENFVLLLATIVAIKLLTKETNIDLGFFILIYIALYILELFFAGLTHLLSAAFSSGKVVAFGALFVIASYLLNILAALAEQAANLKYLSPNFYVDLGATSADKILKPESLLIVVIGVIFAIAGGYLFKRRDIN